MKSESSISIALKLIAYFVVILVASTFISAALRMVYLMCEDIVVGQKITSININLFLDGISIFLPFTIFVSGMLLTFFLIRHSSSYWLPIIVYTLLCATAWIVVLPLCYHLQERYHALVSNEKETVQGVNNSSTQLSSGYFRENENTIAYYSDIDSNDVATGVVIDLEGGINSAVYTFSNEKLPPRKTFADNLIERTVQMPFILFHIFEQASLLENVSRSSFAAGVIAWLCFITMGGAMMATAGLRHLSNWRLLNVLSVMFFTILILVFNILAYTNPVLLSINDVFKPFVKNLPPIVNLFAVLCNLLTLIIFSVVGLIIDLKRKREPDSYGSSFSDED